MYEPSQEIKPRLDPESSNGVYVYAECLGLLGFRKVSLAGVDFISGDSTVTTLRESPLLVLLFVFEFLNRLDFHHLINCFVLTLEQQVGFLHVLSLMISRLKILLLAEDLSLISSLDADIGFKSAARTFCVHSQCSHSHVALTSHSHVMTVAGNVWCILHEATTEVTTGITDITTTEACCTCSTTLPPLTTPEPMTIQEAEEKAQKLRKELSVDVKTLSSTIRKRVSAKDERPSSQLFGVFGVVFIVVVFGTIIIVDIPNLFKTIKVTWKIVSQYLSRKRS
ncbi:hypothetical protein KUTeg_003137 [Tegillarca granosa]|uniref:Uncharacterized protein n=1 Tax=Tegillarca granosa TaxID=220873 RepID=A0ABQ9FMV3_TEGGR|nr:hypothetical protein KUTeg_003137 [Tegillarca granosa]